MSLPSRTDVIGKLRKNPWGSRAVERLAGRRASRRTFSQFGEDAFVLGYLDRLRVERDVDLAEGLVVDVGAYRPVLYSNSYAFHRRGWRCINVDPDPTSIALFDEARGADVNVCCAIGPEAGCADFFVFGSPSIWNTLDPEKAESVCERLQQEPEVRQVDVRTLDSVLDEHVAEDQVELLLIDAEGYDEMILRTCDLARWNPRLVLLEAHGTETADVVSGPLVAHMNDHGYELVAWLNPNLMFARRDSLVGVAA